MDLGMGIRQLAEIMQYWRRAAQLEPLPGQGACCQGHWCRLCMAVECACMLLHNNCLACSRKEDSARQMGSMQHAAVKGPRSTSDICLLADITVPAWLLLPV